MAVPGPRVLQPRIFGVFALCVVYICFNVPGPLYTEAPEGTIRWLKDTYPEVFAVITKCLPILALVIQTAQLSSKKVAPAAAHQTELLYGRLISAGLVISAVGDAFLDMHGFRKGDVLFIGGLGAFLVAHILYIAAFRTRAGPISALTAIVLSCYAGLMLYVLRPGLKDDMVIPVTVYATAISTMGYTALTAQGARDPTAWWHAVIGALLFAISDSILAINEFGPDWLKAYVHPHPKLLVMLTYYLAQTSIASSVRWVLPATTAVFSTEAATQAGSGAANGVSSSDLSKSTSSESKPRSGSVKKDGAPKKGSAKKGAKTD